VPFDVQVRVFFRDAWLCHWCRRPVIFPPALRLLQHFVETSGNSRPLAYFHPHWSRHSAPLLDHLGAVVDHVEAYSRNSRHTEANFVTACNKCNARKSDRQASDYRKQEPGTPIRGKYGEPCDWDGFVSLFLLLAERTELRPSEQQWALAFRSNFRDRASQTGAGVQKM